LGGNRKSKSRTYLNLATVMFLGGLWHGASWNFVVWGMLHGLYLALHKMILDKFPFLKNNHFFRTKIGIIFSIFVTQYFVFLTWIAFRVSDFNELMYSIEKYIFLDFAIEKTSEIIIDHRFEVVLMIIFFILHLISYKNPNLLQNISRLKIQYWVVFFLFMMLTIFFFYDGNPEDFIYFQF